MKILYYSTPSFADCDFPLVRQFQKMGHEVFYFIDFPCFFTRSTLVDVKEQIQKDGIFKASRYKEFDAYRNYMSFDKVYVINRTEKSAFHPKNIALFIEFASFIRQIRPDVINVVGGIDVLSSILLKFRKKLVLTVHDPFPHTGEQSFRREFFRKLALKTFPRFVLLNKSQKNDFIKAYKLRADQVFTTRLGVYDCIYNFVKDGGGDGANNVLFFGRISPYKGIEYLLRAMKIVHCRIPDATLTVAGGGRMYFDVSDYSVLPYIEIRNHYVGMEELAGLIKRAKIIVCPYTDATQSGVIMTAYSLCKPVIATNVGGLVEMVDDGKSGLLIPPRDVDALADAIIEILLDTQRQYDMQKYIRTEYFDGEKSWKNIAAEYVSFYSS